MPGPMYETPAEIGMLRDPRRGGWVGMSVVPEAVRRARYRVMRILGLFFVTNQVGVKLNHEDVVAASDRMAALGRSRDRDVLAKGDRWTVT